MPDSELITLLSGGVEAIHTAAPRLMQLPKGTRKLLPYRAVRLVEQLDDWTDREQACMALERLCGLLAFRAP